MRFLCGVAGAGCETVCVWRRSALVGVRGHFWAKNKTAGVGAGQNKKRCRGRKGRSWRGGCCCVAGRVLKMLVFAGIVAKLCVFLLGRRWILVARLLKNSNDSGGTAKKH